MSGLSGPKGISIGERLSVDTGLSIGNRLTFDGFSPSGDKGILLENLVNFLMLENGVDFLVQE